MFFVANWNYIIQFCFNTIKGLTTCVSIQPACDTLVIQGWDRANRRDALRYCMPYPYDVLSAAAYPAVTNARASGGPTGVMLFSFSICSILRVASYWSYCTICGRYISRKATTVTTRIIHFCFVYVRNPKLKPFIFHWHCLYISFYESYEYIIYL